MTSEPAYKIGQPVWVMRMVNRAKNRHWQQGVVHHYREDLSADGVDRLTVKLGKDSYLKLVGDGQFTYWRKYLRAEDYEVTFIDPKQDSTL